MSTLTTRDLALDPDDGPRLANLAGPLDEHLRQIELRLGVEIANRGNLFRVIGEERSVAAAARLLRDLYAATEHAVLSAHDVHLHLQEAGVDALLERGAEGAQDVTIRVKRGVIKGRGPNQAKYLHAIATHDINFGIGPAGTGKTYLAVASAVDALEDNRVQRLILVRPAVEAGEKLGFLPGDLSQKVDPYLRPLYDALYEMLGFEKVAKLIERNVIEVAPLAYMRCRLPAPGFAAGPRLPSGAADRRHRHRRLHCRSRRRRRRHRPHPPARPGQRPHGGRLAARRAGAPLHRRHPGPRRPPCGGCRAGVGDDRRLQPRRLRRGDPPAARWPPPLPLRRPLRAGLKRNPHL